MVFWTCSFSALNATPKPLNPKEKIRAGLIYKDRPVAHTQGPKLASERFIEEWHVPTQTNGPRFETGLYL